MKLFDDHDRQGVTIELSKTPQKHEPFVREYFDVIAVFCLAVLPYLSRCLIHYGSTQGSTFVQLLLALIVGSIQVAVPILLIMRLRKVVWSEHGFVSCRPIRDVLVGVGLMVVCYLAYYISAYGFYFAGLIYAGDANTLKNITMEASLSPTTVLLIVIASAANAFTEELAMRSYLIPRITDLSGSSAFAIVLTSALFASYHSYQGQYGVISAFAIGIVLAIYFSKAKRFWPIVIAHFFMDAIPLAMIASNGSA